MRRLAAAGVREILVDGHVTDRHFDPVARTFTPVTRTDPLHLARLG